MATRSIHDQDSKNAKTRVVGGRTSVTRIHTPTMTDDEAGDVEIDPVVGWLVVTEGPGKGAAVALGYGMNSVGRGEGNRAPIDFGDMEISSDDNFRVAYDGKSREFHVTPAKGANLVYLDGRSVLAPTSLTAGAELKVGATALRFVALCGPGWDWADKG